jgi:hypothetical protein
MKSQKITEAVSIIILIRSSHVCWRQLHGRGAVTSPLAMAAILTSARTQDLRDTFTGKTLPCFLTLHSTMFHSHSRNGRVSTLSCVSRGVTMGYIKCMLQAFSTYGPPMYFVRPVYIFCNILPFCAMINKCSTSINMFSLCCQHLSVTYSCEQLFSLMKNVWSVIKTRLTGYMWTAKTY